MEKEKIVNLLKGVAVVLAVIVLWSVFKVFPEKKPETIVSNSGEKSQEVIATTSPKISSTTTVAKKTIKEVLPCPQGSGDFNCYMDYYEYLTLNKSVAEAFRAMKEDFAKNSYVVAQCHPLTHVIGRVATEKYKEVNEAFKYGDPFCWSGYYHGVMEKIIEKVGISKVSENLDSICSLIPGKDSYSFDYYNCVHGLGHGLMAITENELFESLKLCDNLSGFWEQGSCHGGVYMENVIIDNKGEKTKYLKPEDPIYPCNAVGEKYKTSCYLMQTSYALKVSRQDFSKVFEICRSVEEGYRALCLQSLGRDASGQTSSNAEATRAKCYLGIDHSEKLNCVIGAVKDFISYFHSDVEAKNFCSILSDDLIKGCLDTTVAYYRSF